MAGKTKPMSQIKQLLRLHERGYKIKQLARELLLSKNTVKSYLNKVKDNGWSTAALLKLEDPELERKFHSGNPAYKDSRYDLLKSKLDYYVGELSKTGVTKALLYEEYQKDFPEGYSRSQFCHHLLQSVRARKPSMVLSHEPADKLYIDFAGKTLSYTDADSGEIISCQVFVACLPYSDYGFAIAVRSQKLADFIYALTKAIEHFGGLPRLIVPDNFKAAVIKANRYEPDLNRALEDFANHYNTSVLPTRVAKPKDKALVENQVKLVYSRVFARIRDRTFLSLKQLNDAISECMQKHNQTRMQDKPWCRQERFLAEEKPKLIPLQQQRFEIKNYVCHTVAKNNHIKLSEDKKYYSVPYQYIGKKVKVIYTRSIVRIYYNGKQIALHTRIYNSMYYSTKKEHLCSHHQHYLDRSPEYYIRKATLLSAELSKLFECIFQRDRHPEQLYKTCDGLLSIYRKIEKEKADKACKIALMHKNYSYKFFSNVIENNMIDVEEQTAAHKSLPEHSNIRGSQYYNQLNSKNKS